MRARVSTLTGVESLTVTMATTREGSSGRRSSVSTCPTRMPLKSTLEPTESPVIDPEKTIW